MSCPEDLRNPYFAPLLAKSLADQPDTLVITAEYDPLRDEERSMHVNWKIRQPCGIAPHCRRPTRILFFAAELSTGQECYEIINRFLSEVPQA